MLEREIKFFLIRILGEKVVIKLVFFGLEENIRISFRELWRGLKVI